MPRTIVVHHNPEPNNEANGAKGATEAADLALIDEFRHAIETGQLVLHYQPKATLISERVEAVEALVFWRHPQLGLLYPDRFLPLVEQTDLIDHLTKWVLRQALDDLRGLGRNADHVTMAVNVSTRNISGPGFAGLVERSLIRAQISPGPARSRDHRSGADRGPRRRQSGTRATSIRSASTSASTTSAAARRRYDYLSTLPVHELKIDRSFIGDMLVNPAHAAIVRSIVDLGHDLHLRVVGEGVESDVVWEILRALGCDSAQGYVLARPMPVEQLGHWLENSAHESFGLVENSMFTDREAFTDQKPSRRPSRRRPRRPGRPGPRPRPLPAPAPPCPAPRPHPQR